MGGEKVSHTPFPAAPGSTTGCERRPSYGQDYDTGVGVVAGVSFQWCSIEHVR